MSYHTVRSRASYARRVRLSDLRSAGGHGITATDDSSGNRQNAMAGKSEPLASVERVLTLDDFGGRSDALGG